jgi:hypothetical protein
MTTLFRLCLLLTPLCFSACTIHSVGKHKAITLDTGNEVVDAASYLVAGAKLQKKIHAEKLRNGELNNPNDPVVKQMNQAIEKAKDRKHGLAPVEQDSAGTSLVIKKTSQSGGGYSQQSRYDY